MLLPRKKELTSQREGEVSERDAGASVGEARFLKEKRASGMSPGPLIERQRYLRKRVGHLGELPDHLRENMGPR